MSKTEKEFSRLAGQESDKNVLGEFWAFLGHTKKWWLLPILVTLLLLGLVMLLSGSAVAPFIYTLF